MLAKLPPVRTLDDVAEAALKKSTMSDDEREEWIMLAWAVSPPRIWNGEE